MSQATTTCDDCPLTHYETSPLKDAADTSAVPISDWSDPQLVRACLQGDQAAWAGLIRRYQNLIYFFPRRYGAGPADAADVFQLVCAELFVALPQLRDHQCLRSWIMSVSAHQSYHWKRGHLKRAQREGDDPETTTHLLITPPSSELEEAQRDDAVREAIEQLPPRCRKLVRLLFYEDPPLPYQSVAKRLGLATGSIGLTRSRCLKKLEGILERQGLEAPSRGPRPVGVARLVFHRATGEATSASNQTASARGR